MGRGYACPHKKGHLPGIPVSIVVERENSGVSLPGSGSQLCDFLAERVGQVKELP